MSLTAKNISFQYNHKLPWLLNNVSLNVAQGEIVALFAPSGYGKTTLAMILAGYLKPNTGHVFVSEKSLQNKQKCPIQLIYQHPEKAINPRWKLRKVIAEAGSIETELMQKLGIEEEWLDRYPNELSGGELQRFCVARALFANPRYIICDEISTMLDVITQAQIWNVLLDEVKKRNLGLLVVTHNKHLADQIATRVIDLRDLNEE